MLEHYSQPRWLCITGIYFPLDNDFCGDKVMACWLVWDYNSAFWHGDGRSGAQCVSGDWDRGRQHIKPTYHLSRLKITFTNKFAQAKPSTKSNQFPDKQKIFIHSLINLIDFRWANALNWCFRRHECVTMSSCDSRWAESRHESCFLNTQIYKIGCK